MLVSTLNSERCFRCGEILPLHDNCQNCEFIDRVLIKARFLQSERIAGRSGSYLQDDLDYFDWTKWVPGDLEAANYLRINGSPLDLRLRLSNQDIFIGDLTDTQLFRISELLVEVLCLGLGTGTAEKFICGFVGKQRASQIAQVEMSLAVFEATKINYEQNFVEMVDWQTAGDGNVCHKCHGYALKSPYKISNLPQIPVHVGCGCQIIPAK